MPTYSPSETRALSRQPSATSDPVAGAVVKRFDAERGFGFVALDGGSGDAFLHISALQQAGMDAVAPGTRLRVRVGQGQRGPQVTEVLEVGDSEEASPPPRGPRTAAPSFGSTQPAQGEEVRGTVKWYSAEKGFGFVAPNDGSKDVFVHATALERSGVAPLSEGQAVTMQVVQGKKGLEASTIRLG
ncbi:cold-shock protein [Roseomonas xinghualingensis]|uniref:cold-shock protein n=2 Tax=Roseomonas xinghualingensis TaxID=2986475 RepID=UPI00298D7F96|nr:cold shock domain-containing protein [Roseomonas sp. SXEYE001]